LNSLPVGWSASVDEIRSSLGGPLQGLPAWQRRIVAKQVHR
jgi:hypothetical protein